MTSPSAGPARELVESLRRQMGTDVVVLITPGPRTCAVVSGASVALRGAVGPVVASLTGGRYGGASVLCQRRGIGCAGVPGAARGSPRRSA